MFAYVYCTIDSFDISSFFQMIVLNFFFLSNEQFCFKRLKFVFKQEYGTALCDVL